MNDTLLKNQLDSVLNLYAAMQSNSRHKDLSDLLAHERQSLVTRAISAVHRISGRTSTYSLEIDRILKDFPHLHVHTSSIIGITKALRDDLDLGYIQSLTEIVHSEVFSDFIDMAKHLCDNGYKDAAAVMAGSTLESHVKMLATKFSIPLESAGKPIKAEKLNQDLSKISAYSLLDQKNITAWLDLRNKAAHGNYGDYNIDQVRLLIEGLFGDLNYDIKIEDNKLILVAENGSGKTTIVNIIYYFLSRQWTKLLRYRFESIGAKINGKPYTLNRKDIDILSSDKFKRLLKRYPMTVINKINDLILSGDINEVYNNPLKTQIWADHANLPMSVIYDIVNVLNREQLTLFEQVIPDKEKGLSPLIDCQILYLPTFRRIEQDLKAIFPDLESDIDKYKRRKRGIIANENTGYVELVEFGMEDVEDKIRYKLTQLKENLSNKIKNNLTGGYLRDVINRTYLNISYNQIQAFNEKALSSILDRIDESVLSKNEKSRLIQFVNEINRQGTIDKDETKIIAYFIYRLSTIYNELKEEEKDVENFINICNEYSRNKRFIYDNINFNITIKPLKNDKIINKETIELKDLSSGEKQIVSLFSHLYLSQQRNFFLIIDEPELSLSVPWQKKFIVDVINNPYCKGLLSVTHSPFIFDENELDKYAHGLNEFSF